MLGRPARCAGAALEEVGLLSLRPDHFSLLALRSARASRKSAGLPPPGRMFVARSRSWRAQSGIFFGRAPCIYEADRTGGLKPPLTPGADTPVRSGAVLLLPRRREGRATCLRGLKKVAPTRMDLPRLARARGFLLRDHGRSPTRSASARRVWKIRVTRVVMAKRVGFGIEGTGGSKLALACPPISCRSCDRPQARADFLAFLKVVHSGPFNCRNVDENVLAAAVRLNEPESLGRVEPLNRARSHVVIPRVG
jgi:hypothetical protein